MLTPTLTSNPYALSQALRRIAERERQARQRRVRRVRPGFWQRLCKRAATHAQREHTVRLPGGETIHSNLSL